MTKTRLNTTPTLPAPGSDWLRRIDDVAHDVIAAAAGSEQCVQRRRRAQRRRDAATKRFKPPTVVDVIVAR